MKKTYLRPETEMTNIQSVGLLAQSWSEDGGTGDFTLNDGTASNPAAAPKDFSFWSRYEAW